MIDPASGIAADCTIDRSSIAQVKVEGMALFRLRARKLAIRLLLGQYFTLVLQQVVAACDERRSKNTSSVIDERLTKNLRMLPL
ncbi:hypothetical protein AX768_30195 (plasmid) [Burkholderia sp. PAMC 28687]|uniref:hypothetical protein n=1 Tax=Burkholderiaceae TaxID=119060 RepID=UPI000780EAF4|nr:MULTISPECIES: hypothetical protein [Burkholderiaceae]AMM18519.1 hypothetical protein AX768_30195 [Burkholderia sp. PAMC 28687]